MVQRIILLPTMALIGAISPALSQVQVVSVDGDPIQIIGEGTGYPRLDFDFTGSITAQWPTDNPSQIVVDERQGKSANVRLLVTGDDPVVARFQLSQQYSYSFPSGIGSSDGISFPGSISAEVFQPGRPGLADPVSSYGTSRANTISLPWPSGSGVDTDTRQQKLYPNQEYIFYFTANGSVQAGISIGSGTSLTQDVAISMEVLPDLKPFFAKASVVVIPPIRSRTITIESSNINSSPVDIPVNLSTSADWMELGPAGGPANSQDVRIIWKAGETAKFEVNANALFKDLGTYEGSIDSSTDVSGSNRRFLVDLIVGTFVQPRVIDAETGAGVAGVTFDVLRNNFLQYRLLSGRDGYPSPSHVETIAGSYTIAIPSALGASDSSRAAAIASNGAATFPIFKITQPPAMAQIGLAVNAPGLRWVSSSASPWFAQTEFSNGDGTAARSGPVVYNSSELETSVVGPGTLTFDWKLSGGASETLEFYLNGGWEFSLSGEVDWESRSVAIPSGVNTVRWVYSNFDGLSGGPYEHAGFLDNVGFVPGAGAQSPSSWLVDAGLFGDDAGLLATPYADGVPNLLKYAFNLNPNGADYHTLSSGLVTTGLPRFQRLQSDGQTVFQLDYLRRQEGGIAYRPLFSTNLTDYVLLTGDTTITDLGNGWERVSVSKPLNAIEAQSAFGKVEVTLQPEP